MFRVVRQDDAAALGWNSQEKSSVEHVSRIASYASLKKKRALYTAGWPCSGTSLAQSREHPEFQPHTETDENPRFWGCSAVFRQGDPLMSIDGRVHSSLMRLSRRPYIDAPIRFNSSRGTICDPMYAKVDSATVNLVVFWR